MSEAARIRESIDLAEFERRLRGASAEPPLTASGPAHAAAAPRPHYPRTAEQADARAAANPVANLREQLEEAASRNDPFHSIVEQYPDAAERFAAPAAPAAPQAASAPRHQPARHVTPPAREPGWRPEAFEPIDDNGARRSRRRMLLLGGAAAVLVVGVGMTIGMRGGSINGSAPTIRASNEPFKIQPETKPAGEKPSESASILDRNGSERLAASRVVTREEQAVDVREAARQASAANPASAAPRPGPTTGAQPSGLPTAGPAANSFFPEPRRVRTVSVRPDGTIIGEAPQAAPVAPVQAPRVAPPAPAPQTAAPAPTRVAAVTPAAVPKASDRAVPTTTASTSGAAPTPAAPAAARVASPQSATVAATPRSSGAFAVQLAGAGSESEARATISRLQQRYGAALGGRQPVVRKATVGAKEVYRVRVVGLSQGDASGLCEKLKSAGGTCFIARE